MTHASALKTRQLIWEFQQIISSRKTNALGPWLKKENRQ
jgi:hypothetical protein